MSSWKNFVESLKNSDLMNRNQEAQAMIETGNLQKARLFLLEELEKKPKSQSLLFTMAGLLEEQEEYLAISKDFFSPHKNSRISLGIRAFATG